MRKIFTPPAEIHIEGTTEKNTVYMVPVLNASVHKEEYREPKIHELHINPINSSNSENETVHHFSDSVESSEPGHDEYMNPFLPELDNDTFVNSLHSEEHFVDHDNHDNVSTIKPSSGEHRNETSTPAPADEHGDRLVLASVHENKDDQVSTLPSLDAEG
uniref:Uncharacterized protein LOC114345298 n=1 Tax=Diabrotica virgifera virgifera TaxID=50390 RepID=A0A6P7H7L2_DIAVI